MLEHRTLIQSFKYAFEGIYFAFKYNQNIRIHFVIAIFVIFLSIFFRVSAFEMGILGVTILLVISTEMINTSIEEMANLITKDHRQEAKIAKDVAAGMVLLTSTGAVIVGILVFIPHVLKFF
jgi:diacylglycerol kinase (ATP)